MVIHSEEARAAPQRISVMKEDWIPDKRTALSQLVQKGEDVCEEKA